MLVPLPTELFRNFYAPVTWTLIILNYVIFLWTHHTGVPVEGRLEEIIKNERYVQTQGWVYSRYIKMHTHRYSVEMNKLADLVSRGERVETMSRLAINDSSFIKEGGRQNYVGDQVAIAEWKQQFEKFLDLRESSPALSMGLSSHQSGLENKFSYQFVHSGFLHFAGNMCFLLLFGTLLEPLLGGLSVLAVYLLSGFVCGFVFSIAFGDFHTAFSGGQWICEWVDGPVLGDILEAFRTVFLFSVYA